MQHRLQVLVRSRAREEHGLRELVCRHAVVHRPHDVKHRAAFFEQVDEGHKQVTLQPPLIKRIRRAVGGGDEDEAHVKERHEQAFQDHGI